MVLVDHAERLAEKIRISGGGRCNFTNLGAGPANFLSENPHFCRSALAGYTPQDFLALLKRHRVSWHEKHRGQLFCDDSSESIIGLLRAECDEGRVAWRMGCSVAEIAHGEQGFELRTSQGLIRAAKLVVATGGMAIPQLGATDFGLKIARQFGLKIVEPRPALVPLTFDAAQWQPLSALSGVALEVSLSTGQGKARGEFLEDLLFTHRGLSGPAILQISSYWKPGEPIVVDLAPGRDLAAELLDAKSGNRQQLHTVLAGLWPKRLADASAGAGGAGRQARTGGLETGRCAGQDAARVGPGHSSMDADAQRHGRLQEGRGHARRRGYARAGPEVHAGAHRARPVLHRRGRGRDRLAGRLQLPVGLGLGRGLRQGAIADGIGRRREAADGRCRRASGGDRPALSRGL